LNRSSEKLQNALDESRTLILGAQIIVGLLYRSVFEPGYDRMPRHSQDVLIGALVTVLAAFVLLVGPVAFHRIVDRGMNRPDLEPFVLAVMKPTLPLFAISMGLTIYIATEKVDGAAAGAVCSVAGTGLPFVLWYRVGTNGKKQGKKKVMQDTETRPKETLDDKIKHVLTEARMVLPGAQALLGFQFVTMVLNDFDRLPRSSKEIHLFSLFATAVSTVLLMAPAAHHRIVEKGANSEEFHRLAGRFVVLSLVPLAIGITGDFYVVMRKVSGSVSLAAASATALLLASFALWFGYTFYRRAQLSSDK
jgi:hypothetical protein